MDYLLVLNKVPRGQVAVTPDSRLPGGISVPMSQWDDVKRSFAFFLMVYENKCAEEVKIMFDFEREDWYKENSRVYGDGKNDQLPIPEQNKAALRYSKEKASVLAKALEEWKPRNKRPPPPMTVDSYANDLLEEQNDIDSDDKEDDEDDAATVPIDGASDDEDDGDEDNRSKTGSSKNKKTAKTDKQKAKEVEISDEEEDQMPAKKSRVADSKKQKSKK